jgi:L-ascorbate metabolism protein UlaG (beta-lactamase superfamily)
LDDFVVYVDAVSDYGIYTRYPKADLILVTHEHADHLDGGVIKTVSKPGRGSFSPRQPETSWEPARF